MASLTEDAILNPYAETVGPFDLRVVSETPDELVVDI
jgi:hypothetical protein